MKKHGRRYQDRRYDERRLPPAEPKPFFWINLHGEPRRTSLEFHDRFANGKLTGCLRLDLEVRSEYLYVGSGEILLDSSGRAYYAFVRRNGKLVIPGTSLKGPIRAILEAISNSCVSQVARGENAGKHKACSGVEKEKERTANLCTACRIFGTTGYRGRAYFADATLKNQSSARIVKIADLWPPRQAKGRKFYQAKTFVELDDKPERNHRFLEAVPQGTVFSTSLFFENLSPAEMGLMIRSLGMDISSKEADKVAFVFPIKLGGAKPRCLGTVRFAPTSLCLLPPVSDGQYFEALARGGDSFPITDCMGKMLEWLRDTSLLDSEAWQIFRAQAGSRPNENCPKELY